MENKNYDKCFMFLALGKENELFSFIAENELSIVEVKDKNNNSLLEKLLFFNIDFDFSLITINNLNINNILKILISFQKEKKIDFKKKEEIIYFILNQDLSIINEENMKEIFKLSTFKKEFFLLLINKIPIEFKAHLDFFVKNNFLPNDIKEIFELDKNIKKTLINKKVSI